MNQINYPYLSQLRDSVRTLARLAFQEDIPESDVTADFLQLGGVQASAHIICREPVSFCGAAWFDEVVAAYNEAANHPVNVVCEAQDGQRLEAGSRLFSFQGDTAAIVGIERTLLNFLGRAVGIANATWDHVARVRRVSAATQILDTRKTLPGYRYFDKYAVLCGGGQNHRMNLSDMILIKENHLARFGGVAKAMDFLRGRHGPKPLIQVEVSDLAMLDEALAAACPLIMLDNFTPEMVATAMSRDLGASRLEVSGGINLDNITDYAQHGPHRISTGAVTHSVKAPDLSLLIHED